MSVVNSRAQQVQWHLNSAGITGVQRRPAHNTILVPGYALFVEGRTNTHQHTPDMRLRVLAGEWPAATPVVVRHFHDDVSEALAIMKLDPFIRLIGGTP